MKKIFSENNLLARSLLLALIYALIWSLLHQLFHFPNPGGPKWIPIQILTSTLIFFTLNGLFASFSSYRWGVVFQILISSLYIHPVLHILYFKTYQAPIDQQILSLVLREPNFLIKVLRSEMTFFRFVLLAGGVLCFFLLNRFFLKRRNDSSRFIKPYDLFLNKWSLLFVGVMVVLQIKWCLDHDRSLLIMRPFYPVILMMLVSVLVYLVRSHKNYWEKSFVAGLIFLSLFQFYFTNMVFAQYKHHFSFETQYYQAAFGAYFVQAGFNSLGQDRSAIQKYHELSEAKMDYNILFVLNDTQRWDKQSSNGFPKKTDDALDWLYSKSFVFSFPISPSNSTDTSLPALLSGYSSEQEMGTIKGNLIFWDYFSKGAHTFMISSQDITWSRLDLFYKSIGLQKVWNATAQPTYKGNPEDVDDILSYNNVSEYVPTIQGPWVGLWQTFASHFPYTVAREAERYLPCNRDRNHDLQHFENCYLNAQVYSAQLRSEFFKKLDLEKTVIVMTSDHGEGMGEHGVFFHGTDFHQEMVKVPFVIYIPPSLQQRLPAQALANIKKNTTRVVSTIDILPTMLDLHRMLTGQKLQLPDQPQMTGRSLFEDWDYRLVFSSGCFLQYRCYSREIMFADDNYYVIFRPSEGFYKIYRTHEDLAQTHPLTLQQVDSEKFIRLLEEAAKMHVAGKSMKSLYELAR